MATAPGPTVTLHHLARYLVATPLQRKRTVEDQKRPFGLSDLWYEFADNAITRSLCEQDPSILAETIEDLQREGPEHPTDAVRLANNAEALLAFQEAHQQLADDPGPWEPADREHLPPLRIAGVDIAVAPELVSHRVLRGRPSLAVIKLYFSKDTPLDTKAAHYMTALLQHYAEQHLKTGDESVVSRGVKVWDVFAGTAYEAPAGTAQRLREIEIACEEIALWWNAV